MSVLCVDVGGRGGAKEELFPRVVFEAEFGTPSTTGFMTHSQRGILELRLKKDPRVEKNGERADFPAQLLLCTWVYDLSATSVFCSSHWRVIEDTQLLAEFPLSRRPLNKIVAVVLI